MADKYHDVTEYVVCAACRRKSDGLIVTGARHYDPIMRAVMNQTGGPAEWGSCDQGFINQ